MTGLQARFWRSAGYFRSAPEDKCEADGLFAKVPKPLKKSFLADDQNSSVPLVRPTRGNVRDHTDSVKSDHRPWHLS
jgi:hypothetical protein